MKKNPKQRNPKLSIYGRWKSWKRPSFTFYFVLAAMALVFITVVVALIISNFIAEWSRLEERLLIFIILISVSLTISFGLALIVGHLLLKPISNLQESMNKVAEGNLSVKVEEKNSIEEVENINHSFNLMIKELRSNYEMQKDFVSNVSHEFKTPLSAIEGYATLLQDGSLTEEERDEYVQEILSTTKLMSDLVSNILLLSKLENQAIDYTKTYFSLDEQIRKVVVLLEPAWTEKNLQIAGDFDEIEVYNNPTLLMNVWRNLIENAIKFSPRDGQISLQLCREGREAVFSVTDEGPGVKNKEQIFDKFYQEDTSRKQQGNGLGLALVNKIMDVVHGKVEVENLEPKGCRFTIRLALY